MIIRTTHGGLKVCFQRTLVGQIVAIVKKPHVER